MPPDVTRRPPGPQPDDRLADQITADAPAERRTTVCIVADIVLEAADLIAGRGELDQRAYERGRLDGFADGWRCGLKAAARRYLRQSDNWIREKRSRVRSDPTGTPQTRSSPGPEVRGHPEAESLARTAAASPPTKEDDAVHIVRQVRRSRHLPTASASLYEPAANRTQWWISLRCPHCGSVHLGRVRAESEAAGPRRTGCGRMVLVVVRRTYRGHSSKQVAA
jgi:hypothetical protein